MNRVTPIYKEYLRGHRSSCDNSSGNLILFSFGEDAAGNFGKSDSTYVKTSQNRYQY